jgi:hypothetical protein
MAARLEAPRASVRPVTVTPPARRAGPAWPRLPAAAELATIGAGYLGYALVRHRWLTGSAARGVRESPESGNGLSPVRR